MCMCLFSVFGRWKKKGGGGGGGYEDFDKDVEENWIEAAK